MIKDGGFFFKKEIERVGGLLNKKEGREGHKGKMPFLLPPYDGKQRRGAGGAAMGRRPLGLGGARE
jgi:hypothetical protein